MAVVVDAPPDIVWDNGGNGDIQSFFKNPPWIDADKRAATGESWYNCMIKARQIYLFDKPGQPPNNVPKHGEDIYNQLASGNMPQDSTDRWPTDNLEQLRLWYNAGCRVHPGDPTPGPNGEKHVPPFS